MKSPIITPSRRLRPRSEPRARTQEGDNLLGAGLMVLSATATVSNDTAMKFVSQGLPLSEAMFVRGLMIMALLWLLAQRDGGLVWWLERPRDRWLLALRSICEIGATVLYLSALQQMEIGMLSAIMQSLPLLIMLAAAVVYGERLGWRRMLAVAVGIAGVMMIVRPGTDAFDMWSLMGLGSVLFVLLRDLVTRSLGREVRTSSIAFNAALGVTIAGAFLPSDMPWRAPTTAELGLLSLAAGLLMVGYLSAVATMRVGEVGFVAPFRYTQLIVAGVLGFIVFGERPDSWTLTGAALIVSAGLYSIWRETRLRKAT